MKEYKGELLRSQCYGAGKWLENSANRRMAVVNPATGQSVGSVPMLSAAEVATIITAAHQAWPSWKTRSAKERSILLRRLHDLILGRQDELAAILTAEQGKPLAEAKEEILHGASYFEWYAEEAKRVYGDTIPMSQGGKRIIVLKEPVGLCAAITPWNFPFAMIARKAAPALAAGCVVIAKPASQTPLSALALAWLCQQAAIPDGVFNVVTGESSEIGPELTSNPLVRKLSFTGSTEVGKLLMRQCAASVKRVSLELGGHAPFIVFEDADIDAAVRGAMASKYRNSGQTCVCANRFLVHAAVYEDFAHKLIEAVQRLKVGNGLEQGMDQGPLIDLAAVRKVEAQIADALALGARLGCGGNRLEGQGFFFAPTVLLDVRPEMRIAQEETFGPVAPLFVFRQDAEAIHLANSTPYGLAAYFYSRDIGRIWRSAEALEFGMVGVNTGRMSSEAAPFGGIKESGMGREGSKYGMDEYLELKYLCLGGLNR